MKASLDYLITPSEIHNHHAEWVIENRLAVGRREPSRLGATDGRFEIHFISAHDNSEILKCCSNLHLDFIPPIKMATETCFLVSLSISRWSN